MSRSSSILGSPGSSGGYSRIGEVTATLAHAAPEILAGQPASEASDVYSLASTLYELLSGHAPFARSTDETFHPLLQRVLNEDPPGLRASDLPHPIWEALNGGLANDPAARTPSARAFGEALQNAQHALGVPLTPLVLPSATSPVDPATIGDRAATVLGGRRRHETAPAPDQPTTVRRSTISGRGRAGRFPRRSSRRHTGAASRKFHGGRIRCANSAVQTARTLYAAHAAGIRHHSRADQ